MEESEVGGAGVLVANAVMKVSDLTNIFIDLSTQRKHFPAKNDMVLIPIQLDGKQPFIVVNTPIALHDLPTCTICDPPMVIGKPHVKPPEMQRALRNHTAAHQLTSDFPAEPCAFCCQPIAKLVWI